MRIKRLLKATAQLPHTASGTLHRRLLLFTFILILLLGAVTMGGIVLFGRVSDIEKTTGEKLDIQLSVYEQDIAEYFDHVAARGIELSANLSAELENYLSEKGIAFHQLSGQSEVIVGLQEALLDPLRRAMALTDCSGVYCLLDATVNSTLPNAENSKCGVYLKIANLNMRRPTNPKLLLFRGSPGSRDQHRLEYHNMWSLEFRLERFPFYETMQSHANRDLNQCYLFTNAFPLPGTWENVMLLCVPILSSDGDFLGVCGFEISTLYFKLYHAQSGAIPHITGLLAPKTDEGLDSTVGLESGDKRGYFADLSGSLTDEPETFFRVYRMAERQFIGQEQPIRLSPLESERTLSILIPKEDFDAEVSANARENIVIVLLLLLSAIFGSVTMSHLYVKPIASGLRQVMNHEAVAETNIREIDDLFAFLSEQDALRESPRAQPDGRLNDEQPAPELSAAFADFKRNVGTLSRSERKVFDLYTEGLTAQQIATELNISMNTVKTHNRHIYEKLYVTSYKEMLVYVNLMKSGEPSVV